MPRAGRLANAMLLALPGAVTVYFGFNAGGFYEGGVAFGTLVLAVALVLRIALAESPFGGWGALVGVTAVAMALFALWVLVSGRWGMHAPGRSLIEFDRALLYLLALLLFASIPRTPDNLRWMIRGLALAIVAISVAGLATRVLPDVFPTASTLANDRLSYPVKYWNALGLLGALGVILCLYLASDTDESRLMRVLGAASVPALATTVFFTFSRGAIAAGIAGLVAYVAVGRPKGALGAGLATIPATVVAIVVAYHADLLASETPTTAAATDQGHRVAVAVAACMVAAAAVQLALLWIGPRASARFALRPSRRAGLIAGACAAIALLALVVALDVPSGIGDQYDKFVHNRSTGVTGGDLRTRFTNPTNNGRIDTWGVAVDEFADRPLAGSGAGTYQNVWAINREIPLSVRDAHSLYAEVMGELGIVGLLLLATAIATILGTMLLRSLRDDRALYAALFAAALTWAIHAGVDWDWEMPVVTLWVFALGGAALAAAPGTHRQRPPGSLLRTGAVVACIGIAVVPALVLAAQTRLDDSADAFERGDCATAVSDAGDAISVLGVRAEPYEIRGFCRLKDRRARAAIADFEKAVDRDPGNWTYHYDLALAKAAAGESPAGQALVARAHNPLDEEARDLARRLVTRDKRRWRREARRLLRGAGPFYLSTR